MGVYTFIPTKERKNKEYYISLIKDFINENNLHLKKIEEFSSDLMRFHVSNLSNMSNEFKNEGIIHFEKLILLDEDDEGFDDDKTYYVDELYEAYLGYRIIIEDKTSCRWLYDDDGHLIKWKSKKYNN